MPTYRVTTCDICAQGYERLRNMDEFMLTTIVVNTDSKEDILCALTDDFLGVARRDGFDYAKAKKTYTNYIEENWTDIKRRLKSLDDPEVDKYGDISDDYSIYLFLYVEMID